MPASALMNVMVTAARKAGRALSRDFGEVEQLQVSIKGPGDFVSAADLKAEKIIFEELSHARPGYGFLMEERGLVEGQDQTHRWIVDPLDGTTNFLHSIPQFAISIALEREGTLVAGLVFNPVTNEMWTAERGKGAFLNDRRVRVAARKTLDDCLIITGIPHLGRGDHPQFLKECQAVMAKVSGIRRFGSAALELAYIATGRADALWERNLKPWDMAAGIVILREAGGFISDIQGRDLMFKGGDIVAGNENIHRNLRSILSSVKP